MHIDLLGVSTVHGNASLVKTTSNALSVLKAIGKSHVPVHPGSRKPFCRDAKHAPDIHGDSGLDGTGLLPQPDRRPLSYCNAIADMKDALMRCPPQTAWLVATGALTNIALLFAVFPEVAAHIRGLSIMGGAIGGGYTNVYMGPAFKDHSGRTQARIGNMTPYAEFNIWCDPEAAQSIFRNAELASKTSLITLDLTHQVCANQEVREMLRYSRTRQVQPTRMRQMFYELLVFFAETYEDVFGLSEGPPLHDPLAVAVLLDSITNDPDRLFEDSESERWHVDVVTEGDQAGRTVLTPQEHGVFIPRSVNVNRFWDLVEDCMAKADDAVGLV